MKTKIAENVKIYEEQEGKKYFNKLGDLCLVGNQFLVIKEGNHGRIICTVNIMPDVSNFIQDITSIFCNMLMSQTTLQFIQLETDCGEKFYEERYSSESETTNIYRLLGMKRNSISCFLVKDINNQEVTSAIQEGIQLTKISESLLKLIRNQSLKQEITFESIQQMVDQVCQEYPECLSY